LEQVHDKLKPIMPDETVQHIARTLNESDSEPLAQIERLVNTVGADAALALLARTLEVEAEGGIMTHNGKRRRTPGGAFFFLVRGTLTPEQHAIVFPGHVSPRAKFRPKQRPPATTNYEWPHRVADFALLTPQDAGEGKVEIKIVGRPLKVIERPTVTILTMRSGKVPALPKGLPSPPEDPTIFLVFVANKQWRRVQQVMDDADDKLIIRGWPVYDGKLGAITVLAQSATSVAIERAKQA
jgi:hypothetical protein